MDAAADNQALVSRSAKIFSVRSCLSVRKKIGLLSHTSKNEKYQANKENKNKEFICQIKNTKQTKDKKQDLNGESQAVSIV